MAKCLGKCYIIGAGNYYESWLDMFYEISDEIRILDKWEADSKNLCFACISSQEFCKKMETGTLSQYILKRISC